MKKLIAGLVVLASVSAFAQKSMVKMEGFASDGVKDNSIDFSQSSNDVEDAENKMNNMALNYAYAVTPDIQIGVVYKSYSNTTDGDVGAVGDKSNTLGFSFYYNFDGSLTDTNFVALHLNTITEADTDATDDSGNKQTETVIEYGHRFALGKLWGSTWSYSPSISYNMHKMTPNDSDADDVKTTSLSWDFVAFDVLF